MTLSASTPKRSSPRWASLTAARASSSSSIALLIAQQKIEALRGDSIELQPSPPGTLAANTPPYVEYIGADGRVLTSSVNPPPGGTVFVRRWSIEPLSWSSSSGVVLQVVVMPWSVSSQDVPGMAHLIAVKRR